MTTCQTTEDKSLWSHRQREVAVCAETWCSRWYDSHGRWIAATPEPDTRATLWLCFGLLAGSGAAVMLANAILARLKFSLHDPARSEAEAKGSFDIFATNHAVQLLAAWRDRLDNPVREKMEVWAREALKDYAGDRQADYQFHGSNDNMPSKATLGMILGGEYFDDPGAVAHGLWNLRQLKQMLTRRGLFSEYTSPTYSPLTLVNLTEISLHARHPEARQLATHCCERIWADVLGHFHPPTGTLGGPYARAYQLDSTAHLSTISCLLWLALGERIAFHPVKELNREPMRLIHHHDDKPTQLGLLCWVASCPLIPPASLLEWLEHRSYPFHLAANAERGGADCGEVNTTVYAEEDFALGTAEGEAWTERQADAFFLQYRRHRPLRGMEDLRTAYARYLIDDQVPGDRRKDHLLKPHGIVHTVQKERIALVLACPSLKLEEQPVTALKFSFVLPEHFSTLETVAIEDGHVFIHDGPIYLALRALNATDWGRRDAIRIETAPHYRVLSFDNYNGPPRSFSREELARTLNGFVSILGLASEESFSEFKDRIRRAELLDYFFFGTRTISWRLDDTCLSMSYHLETDRVRYATIDGHPAPRPLWQADGLPATVLPFLGGDDTPPKALQFPYRHMNVVWGEPLWMIASVPGSSDQPIFSSEGW